MFDIKYNLMENHIIYFNDNDNEIVIITAFYNINRSKWTNFSRSEDFYLESLKKLLTLEKNVIVFIDDQYYNNDFIQNYIHNINKLGRTKSKIIPINNEWLYTHCASWRKNEISVKIMDSIEYKEKVKHRINAYCPENIYSDYNAINHCKIDFIKYVIDNKMIENNDYIAWCDCGYYATIFKNNSFEYPYAELDIKKFNLNKLNFCLKNKISELDKDLNYTLIYAPEIFTGCFYAGSIELMNKLYYLYHDCLDELYNNNISDDDQHIYLRCFLKSPELFELFISENKWPSALTYFQKTFNNRFELIKNYINKIKFGQFAEIGVWKGHLSEHILTENTTCNLYCVDPYLNYPDYDDACKYDACDNLYNETMNKLNNLFPNRTKFIRKLSTEAANDINHKLDFVYIDGNHKCQYVLEDLTVWYNKLKPGGIIICDDAIDMNDSFRDTNGDIYIQWNEHAFGKYGVVQACKLFTKELNIPFFKNDTQIIIFKSLFLDKLDD